MLDSLQLEKQGIPTALIITHVFQDSVRALARARGYEAYPAIVLQHPVSSLNDAELDERAREVLPRAVDILCRGAV